MQQRKNSNTVVTHIVADNIITFAVGPQSFVIDAALITFGEANGERQAAWTDLHPNGRAGVIHGIVQKVSDRAAIGRDPETGLSATPEEKFDAMKACAERLQNGGPWNAAPVGGTGNAGGLLYRAMRTLYPGTWADRAAFSAFIKAKAEELKVTESAIRAGYAEVKAIGREMEKIRKAEAMPSGIDSATLLEGLPT